MVTTMEKQLFDKLKKSMVSFNHTLEVPTGKFENGGKEITLNGGFTSMPHLTVPNPKGSYRSMYLMNQLILMVKESAPGTKDRMMAAANLLSLIGFKVELKDGVPTVWWTDIEEHTDNVAMAKIVDEIVNKDFNDGTEHWLATLSHELLSPELKAEVMTSISLFDK